MVSFLQLASPAVQHGYCGSGGYGLSLWRAARTVCPSIHSFAKQMECGRRPACIDRFPTRGGSDRRILLYIGREKRRRPVSFYQLFLPGNFPVRAPTGSLIHFHLGKKIPSIGEGIFFEFTAVIYLEIGLYHNKSVVWDNHLGWRNMRQRAGRQRSSRLAVPRELDACLFGQ